MQYRELGQTGLKVSVIGFGGIPIQRIDLDQAAQVLDKALAGGVNFIDTARGYTDSETKLGQLLNGRRQQVILATKSMARTKQAMATEVVRSLTELQVDYIDLYQLHNVKDQGALDQVLASDGALAALKEAKAQGKIRHIGITGHIPDILVQALETGEFATVQFPINIVEPTFIPRVLTLAKELKMGTIAMKPFAGGAVQENRVDALRFILEQGMDTVIPGMDAVAQVEENLQAGQQRLPLSADERAKLEEEASRLGESFCRRCEYCAPCPKGIDIPGVFLLDGYWSRYNLQGWARERYQPLVAKASDCIECGKCEERCPYQLPIRNMLKQAHEHLS